MLEENFDVFNKSLDISISTIISASAGSGKTTTIEHIVIRALLGIGITYAIVPDKILLTSFTRNAVKEVRERIATSIKSLFLALEEGDNKQLAFKFPYICLDDDSDSFKRQWYMSLLANAISGVESMQIMTLASLQESLMQSLLLGRKPKRIPEPYIVKIEQEKSHEVIEEDLLNTLSAQEVEILEHILKRELHIYGGTNVYVSVMEQALMKIRVDSNAISLLLSENKAMLLRGIKACIKEFASKRYSTKNVFPKINALIVQGLLDRGETIAEIEIEKLLHNSEFISQRESYSGFSLILVDESQDMSHFDLNALCLLIKPLKKMPIIYMVGDKKQCLYRFRGSEPALFKNLLENKHGVIKFGRRGLLARNYRSSKKIITFVNEVFKKYHADSDFEFVENSYAGKHHSNEPSGIFIDNSVKKLGNKWLPNIISRVKYHVEHNREDLAILARTKKDLLLIAGALSSENLYFSYPAVGPKRGVDIMINIFSCFFAYEYVVVTDAIALAIFKDLFLANDIQDQHIEFLKSFIWQWKETLCRSGFSVFINSILESENIFYQGKKIGEVLVCNGCEDICNDFYHISSAIYENLKGMISASISSTGLIRRMQEVMHKHASNMVNDSVIKSKKTNKGIMLYTVHAAKGMEFEVVIYVDLYGRKNKSGITNDVKNQTYVALTRAKNYLDILTDGSGLQELNVCLNRYENDVRKFKEDDSVNVNNSVQLKYIDKNTIVVNNEKYVSYSDLAAYPGSSRYFEKDVELEFSSSSDVGQIVHKAIESYTPGLKMQDEVVDNAVKEKRISKFEASALLKVVNRCVFGRILESGENTLSLHDAILLDRYCVFRESKFFMKRGNDETSIGIIDAVIFDKHTKAVVIVDWKTCILPKEKTLEIIKDFTIDKYSIQWKLYVEVMEKIYDDIKSISFIFCYPRYVSSVNEDCPLICRFD